MLLRSNSTASIPITFPRLQSFFQYVSSAIHLCVSSTINRAFHLQSIIHSTFHPFVRSIASLPNKFGSSLKFSPTSPSDSCPPCLASASVVASAISYKSSTNKDYIRIKAVNFGSSSVNLKVSIDGLDSNSVHLSGASKTVMTSSNVKDENSFAQPNKVVPMQSKFVGTGQDTEVALSPYSFTAVDLLKESNGLKVISGRRL